MATGSPTSTRHNASKELFFPNTHPADDPSLESRISAALWRWRFADPAIRERTIKDTHLASMLEFWMPFSEIESTRRRGTWCDGIPLLTVANLHRTAFAVAGVGYFPYGLEPFELDFCYKRRRDLDTERIAFRFGTLGGGGGRILHGFARDPYGVFTRRPTDLRQWAVAVELTPSSS